MWEGKSLWKLSSRNDFQRCWFFVDVCETESDTARCWWRRRRRTLEKNEERSRHEIPSRLELWRNLFEVSSLIAEGDKLKINYWLLTLMGNWEHSIRTPRRIESRWGYWGYFGMDKDYWRIDIDRNPFSLLIIYKGLFFAIGHAPVLLFQGNVFEWHQQLSTNCFSHPPKKAAALTICHSLHESLAEDKPTCKWREFVCQINAHMWSEFHKQRRLISWACVINLLRKGLRHGNASEMSFIHDVKPDHPPLKFDFVICLLKSSNVSIQTARAKQPPSDYFHPW